MILTIKTDSDLASLAIWEAGERLGELEWTAGRKLSEQLLNQIKYLLKKSKGEWNDLTGLIVFLGPGSFTGLRIGATVANTIAYSLDLPIVGTKGDNWQAEGLRRLVKKENDQQVLPFYGAEPNITKPKK